MKGRGLRKNSMANQRCQIVLIVALQCPPSDTKHIMSVRARTLHCMSVAGRGFKGGRGLFCATFIRTDRKIS